MLRGTSVRSYFRASSSTSLIKSQNEYPLRSEQISGAFVFLSCRGGLAVKGRCAQALDCRALLPLPPSVKKSPLDTSLVAAKFIQIIAHNLGRSRVCHPAM